MNIQKPFLKWVGGKSKLLEHILSKLPKEINNYHEIFLGGGSVLLAVISLQQQNTIIINGSIYAYDLNESLINSFNQIKKNPVKVINHLKNIVKVFKSIQINTLNIRGAPSVTNENYNSTREHYYYWIRDKFIKGRKNTIISAAYFIFLNKTGFRGMYREGSNGKFNIPYGYKDRDSMPGILDEKTILNVSKLIQNVQFICSNFSESLSLVEEGDFVYLDPPYAPEKKDGFVEYTKEGFSLEQHKSLFKKIREIKNYNFIMSNSNVKLVTDNFKDYTIEHILARRAINSKNPAALAKEVVIYNE